MSKLNKFLRYYLKKNISRFHVPGHQGRCENLNRMLGAKFDITEIKGSGFLFGELGHLNPINGVELQLSKLYGRHVVISTCGSTLCIQTMVALCRNKIFLAHRHSSHVSFFNVCAVLGVYVEWFGFDDDAFGISNFNLVELEQKLNKFTNGTCVVFITSPDYYGISADILAIKQICKKFNALLLVDCAHGAHLNFLSDGAHPAMQGAHLVCSSLHKTLPALTGAAILIFDDHIFSKKMVKSVMAKFSTTSPSYLIMSSIDFCADWLKRCGRQKFAELEFKKQKLINSFKLPFLKTDVSKLVLDCTKLQITGETVAQLFRKFYIEPEFYNENYFVLVLSPFLNRIDFVRLNCALRSVENHEKVFELTKQKKLNRKISNNLIVEFCSFDLSEIEVVFINEAFGRVSAITIIKTPPGTVTVASGELINWNLLNSLKQQGVNKLAVLK